MIIDFNPGSGGGGGGSVPSDVYTKAQIDAMISDFITASTDDLINYYLKTETYTQSEVDNLIGAISGFSYDIVPSTASVANPQSNVLYLVGPTGSGSDQYAEYVYANSTWTKIGDTSIDLSNYVTDTELSTMLNGYVTTTGLENTLSAYTPTGSLSNVATSGSYNDLSDTPVLSTVATSGNYNDLTNKPTIPVVPTLATVATTGDYDDLTNKPVIPVVPELATVAETGNYSDLTGTPSIPVVNDATITVQQDGETVGSFTLNQSGDQTIFLTGGGGGIAQQQADWTESDTTDVTYIKNKPVLSTVATSGSYNDLTDKPTIPVVPELATVATSGDYNDLTNKPDIPVVPTLATVATSGSYNDLTDKPAIPEIPTLATVATTGAYSDLTGTPTLSTVATSGSYNDLTGTPVLSTVATTGSYDDLSDKPDIPEVMPEYDLFNMSQSDRADLYSEITGYRESQEFLFENRVYYAGYPTVSMLYGQYSVDGNGNLKKTNTRSPVANTIVFGYKPEVRVNDDNGGAEYTGMQYVVLSPDGSTTSAYDKIEISGGKPYVELAELTTAELEDLYAEIIEDPDAYMNANAVYYNGKPANICFIGQYTADNDGNLVFDDTLAEDTVVFELYTEVVINATDVHTYYALLFSDGTTSDASTTVEAGTAVAGTNDGTNWTSLTIGTETYDIPQGGGSSNAWYGSQYQFDTLGTYDADTDYYISDISYSEIKNTPNLSIYETKADSQAADQALDNKIAGKMDPIVFVGTAGLPSIGTPLEGVTYAIEGETLPLTFTLADQSTVTYNFVID